MSSLTRRIVISAPTGYSLAVAGLLGAAMLAGPLYLIVLVLATQQLALPSP